MTCGADHLLTILEDETENGLYEGLAGIGFALNEASKVSGSVRYRDGARRCFDSIAKRARGVGSGIEWGNVTDIIAGGAGIGLTLLYAARELGEPSYRELAIKAGRRLIELSNSEGKGLKWTMSPDYNRLMPNFSHGTAGVSYFLASLYLETKLREFLDAALKGATYLRSIAVTEGDVCLVFHDEPEGKNLFYLGWCHGPVGTARLFYRLFQATGDREWMRWVERCARGIMTSGIPEKQTPGFWNNVSQCCGSAGVAEFFLSLYAKTGRIEYRDFSRRVVKQLLSRATRDGTGLRWIQAEHRVRPELLIAQTGYMQGAAGIGALLLHLVRSEKGQPPSLRLPDDPF
jgi:lantibiotic modifying enzyme